MKSTGKILMMSLFLLSLSVCTLNAQRPDRGMRGSMWGGMRPMMMGRMGQPGPADT